MSQTLEEKDLYTVNEAAPLLRVSRYLAYQGVKEGSIPSIRIGRKILIPRRQLERLIRGEFWEAREQ